MLKSHNLLVGAVLSVWIGLVVSTFWRMELRFLQPAPRPLGAQIVDPTQRPLAPRLTLETDQGSRSLTGQITLLNFWSPDCACSRFMERHVRQIVQEFVPRGVQVITVIVAPASHQPSERERLLNRWYKRNISSPVAVDLGGEIARQFGVWAGPAAVILNPKGQIEYLGAYNIGRYCDNRKTAYAWQALEALLNGKQPPRRQTPFFGCQVPPEGANP